MPHILEPDCMHVSPRDGRFMGRMRFHQSWYRHHVLYLPPGRNESARGAVYGNMLQDEDGLRGFNFLNASIHQVAEDRLHSHTGLVEANRLRNNMLSSQPMCFNLFGPLALDHALATRFVKGLPGVSAGVEVTGVEFEYAPPKSTHLDDNTAFDAFITYTRPPNVTGFIGIETKLTEPFSKAKYEATKAGYARWLSAASSWWHSESIGSFSDRRYNQLWRNHLLAFAMCAQPDSQYDEGYCAVVYHPEDHDCPLAVKAYRETLQPHANPTLLEWRIDTIIQNWSTNSGNSRSTHDWLSAFRLRYLDLDASQPAWESL